MTRTAEHYLHELQRRSWEMNPPPANSYLSELRATYHQLRAEFIRRPELRQQMVRKYDEIRGSGPTFEEIIQTPEYEDPWSYHTIQWARTETEIELAQRGFELLVQPVVGTTRTREINAVAVAVNAADPWLRDYLILLDGGLLPFLATMSRLLLQMSPLSKKGDDLTALSLDPDAVSDYLEQHPDVIDQIADDALRLITGDYPSHAPNHSDFTYRNQAESRLHGYLYQLQLVFVISHEYGHLTRGHLTTRQLSRRTIPDAATSVVEVEHAWFQEVEADATGVQVATSVGERLQIQQSLAFLAVDMFFASNIVVDLVRAILATGSIESAVDAIESRNELAMYDFETAARQSSHPPPNLRRMALRRLVRDSMSPDRAEQLLGGAVQLDKALTPFLTAIAMETARRL